jgi:tetratricopeptide (TPR) repeat protein
MPPRIKYLSLATATLLFSLSPLLPITWKFEPLVVQAQTTQDRKVEALRLNEEGVQLLNKSQFRESLAKYQQALVIFKEIGERRDEGTVLNNIGLVYSNLGQYPKALEYYQKALAIRREVSDKAGEGHNP